MAKAFNPISPEWEISRLPLRGPPLPRPCSLAPTFCHRRSFRSRLHGLSLNARVRGGWADDVSGLSKAGNFCLKLAAHFTY
jgi:hypothetical protein